jgi:ribose transport system substrate-binding protein
MKRKLIAVLALVLGASALVFAKGTTRNSGSKHKTNERLLIGCNNYLKGIYSLDILEKNFVTTCMSLGVDPMVVNDEGKIENCVTNVDNMISAGVDGIVFLGISDTLFPVVARKCEAAGVGYAFYDHMPSPKSLAMFAKNPHFAGIAATSDLATGKNIADYAVKIGLKKAIVVTGETTDTTHSARTNGFKKTFEAAGGKVLAEGYGTVTIADGMARANDLLTAHPDIDCVYATNGDLGTATIEALKKHPGVHAKLLVTDLDPDILSGLKNGTVQAANGAHWVNIDYTTALLVCQLKGYNLKKPDGTAPVLIVPVMTLPNSYVDLYNQEWIENSPYSAAQLQSLVKPNVTIAYYQKMLDNYNIDNCLKEKVAAGRVLQSVLDKAQAGVGK